jgi:hypothetical protein
MTRCMRWAVLWAAGVLAPLCQAGEPDAEAPRAADSYTGFFEGTLTGSDGKQAKGEARVIAEGGGRYRAVITPTENPPAGVPARFEIATGGGGLGARLDVRTTDAADAPKGVKYEYYEGEWDALPDFSKLTPAKSGTLDYFDLKPHGREENYAFRFTGFFLVPEDGRYELGTSSDDGSRLYIGDKLVADNDGLHGMQPMSGVVELKKGAQPITVTFFQKGGGAGLEVGGARAADKAPEGVALEGTADGVTWKGLIKGDAFEGSAEGGRAFRMTYAERKSPTEGLAPPDGATVLLPFKVGTPPSLDAWANGNWKALPDGSMLVGKGDNKTKASLGSVRLHVEFRIPFMPTARGQGRGNSGVYLQDRYEVQVLDSFGLESQDNDCSGIYHIAKPKVNACLPPLRWQTYDIEFRAARLKPDGSAEANPRITVKQNGVVVHEDLEIPVVTGGAAGQTHVAKAPLRFQDHGNPVRYRNVWIVEAKD